MRTVLKAVLWSLLLAFLLLVLIFLSRRPSKDRDWLPDFALLPKIEIDGEHVRIENIRDSRYDARGLPTIAYYDADFDLRELDTVWFVLSPFREDWRGPAHSFLSFGFADSSFLAVSVEARKEKGESYSIWKGLLRNFEITYVLADERDLIPLRTNIWKDDVYVYPIRTDPEQARDLFIDMLERAVELQEKPEFYNTLTQNCTSALRKHVNHIVAGKVPRSWKLIFTGYSDELALEAGLIDWDGDIDSARRRFRVNDKALLHAEDPNFSMLIRIVD